MKTRWNEFYILPHRFQILGIVLFGMVLLNKRSKSLNKKELSLLLNHERIHIRQQLELLIIPFFIMYTVEWAILYLRYWNNNQAYRNISFEKEAYDHANNLNYLKNRKLYFWLGYWRKAKKH